MSMKFKNNAGSKLAGVLTSDATTITVLTGTGANFPSISSDKDYFHATIVGDNGDMEIVRVTAVSGDTLTVIRAQEDTTAKEWPANTRIENRITAEFLNQVATGDTIKFDQKTIKTNEEGVSAVDPSEVYGIASKDKLGVVKVDKSTISISDDGTISVANGVEVDDVTIKKNTSGVISVKPEGIVDNNTVVLDKDGKISTKSIPFEGGSIFAVLAGNNEGSFTNEGDGINNQQQRPNLGDSSFQKSQDGRSFCHVENNAIVLDEDGFYIVRLRRAFYPDVSNTNEIDLTESISYKPVGGAAFSNIGTQTLRMNNDPDLWQYCDFSIVLHGKAGDAISTLSYEPIVTSVKIYSGSFGLYVFKIPVTNEYQINSSELNTYSKSNFTVPNPNSSPNIFDPGDLVITTDTYTGTLFTRKTDDGYIEILESGVYIIVHGVGVVINPIDGNVYDMPHGMAHVHDGAFQSPMSESTVTVRNNEIVNDYDESTAMVYLTKGDVIAPFIYAPTRIYNPIKIEYSNVRIVKLAAASQITHNHSAYKTITLTNEDNIDNLKPGSYYCPTGVTPQGTHSTTDTDWVLVVFGDGEVVNNSFKQVMYTSHDSLRIKEREYDSGWTTWGGPFSLATTAVNGVLRLATQEQVTAGTEAGAYAVTPALAKAAIETFAPTIVNNTINSSESTLHQTIQNMIDASTPEVTPESFTGILPIAKGGTGNATGNATTATKLATARTITVAGDATGSASFDGSANATITVDVVNATNAVNATRATTATKWSGATKYVSTAAASGGVSGDIWFQYI